MKGSQVGRHQVGRHHEVTVACSPPSSRTSSSTTSSRTPPSTSATSKFKATDLKEWLRSRRGERGQAHRQDLRAQHRRAPVRAQSNADSISNPADRADAPHVRQDDAHHLLRRPHHHHRLRAESAGRPPHADRPQAALHHAQPHPCWWASSTRPITSA